MQLIYLRIVKNNIPKQKQTFSKIFPMAQANCPYFIIETVSILKVEKVLNPPQNPTNKNNRVVSEMGEMNRIAIAIKMQAAILAIKVE
jgi:hypothetical protein